MTPTPNTAAYTVDIDPLALELSVTLRLTGDFVCDGMQLVVPGWVPGDYDFEPYARDLFDVTARDPATDAPLTVTRDGWNGFRIHGANKDVDIRYRAFAYETDFGDAMGLVDSDYAVLMGARYLFCPDYVGACAVTYGGLPDHWTIHHPSGATRDGTSLCWRYPSFEILLDTPVVIGALTIRERTIRKVPFYFAFVDKGVGFAARVDAFVDQLTVAVEAIHDVFGLFPFEDYTFVLSLNPQADWGLEHLTSNMSGLGPDVFVDDDKFANGIRVCAHELFHAWNVRRLRPAPLGQLSHHLTSGSFTEGLWMAEGFTRYYEFLISTRARAYTPDQFFSAVLGYYRHLTQQPAYARVAATDSSRATYLNHAKYPGRVNNSIDYYDKGMLIAFALDTRLRTGSSEWTLDMAFRDFYLEFFGTGSKVASDYVGYTTQEVVAFFNRIEAGLGDWVGALVNEPGQLATPDEFTTLGLQPVYEDTHHLGIFFLNDGAPTIYGVADDMPAAAGLAPGDVIEAVNGFAYTPAALAWAASAPEDVTLTVRRGHRVLDFSMTPRPGRKITGLTWTGDAAQADLISRWLGTDFAPAQGQQFPVSFYENFHGIESMV
ncbi:hypothetical protein [Thetidibacter halocola]|uniref:PDZ domain-containing protein n=1 Tax=Thetidibacter halocola TaxID=2827239 RepID=A0A8J7WK99_9RHOB|nr:hypothetical protein [Thetidibacter halocola]MBS0126878.1 hypothetical protein [Thetidibacter halocola]